jgi:ABC-type transporter Mla subunit MlaD
VSSQLSNLKGALGAYARSTEQQAAGLDPISRACDQSSQQILALIGGSAQRKESEVQAAVNEARGQVQRAAESLRRAAKIAESYANSL